MRRPEHMRVRYRKITGSVHKGHDPRLERRDAPRIPRCCTVRSTHDNLFTGMQMSPTGSGMRIVIATLLIVVMSGAGCSTERGPGPRTPRVAAGSASGAPATSADWAAALLPLIVRPRTQPLPLLIVPAANANPHPDTLLAAARRLRADGVVANVCALAATDWTCPTDQTRPRLRVNKARTDGDAVHVELAFGWTVLPGDTTIEAIISHGVCITEDHRLEHVAGAWKVMKSETLIVC